MARRKIGAPKHRRKTHHHKPAPRRRRRISGVNGSGLINVIGGLGAGSIAARELAVMLGKFFPSLVSSQMLDGAIQAAVGWFLPKFAKGQFFQFFGYGMIANGLQTIAVGTGIISGPGNVMTYKIGAPQRPLNVINGTANLKVVGGIGDNRIQNPAQVNGVPVRARSFGVYG